MIIQHIIKLQQNVYKIILQIVLSVIETTEAGEYKVHSF